MKRLKNLVASVLLSLLVLTIAIPNAGLAHDDDNDVCEIQVCDIVVEPTCIRPVIDAINPK